MKSIIKNNRIKLNIKYILKYEKKIKFESHFDEIQDDRIDRR